MLDALAFATRVPFCGRRQLNLEDRRSLRMRNVGLNAKKRGLFHFRGSLVFKR